MIFTRVALCWKVTLNQCLQNFIESFALIASISHYAIPQMSSHVSVYECEECQCQTISKYNGYENALTCEPRDKLHVYLRGTWTFKTRCIQNCEYLIFILRSRARPSFTSSRVFSFLKFVIFSNNFFEVDETGRRSKKCLSPTYAWF